MAPEKHDEGKQPGFRVSDRRSFSDSGDPKSAPTTPEIPVAVAATPVEAAVPPAAPPERSASGAAPDQPSNESRDLPAIDFHTFILSLGSSALLHLGELDQPDGTESTPDLPLAKHTIDIIGMLQQKTKGNLTPPEERLMESLLYDLRLRYFELSKSVATGK